MITSKILAVLALITVLAMDINRHNKEKDEKYPYKGMPIAWTAIIGVIALCVLLFPGIEPKSGEQNIAVVSDKTESEAEEKKEIIEKSEKESKEESSAAKIEEEPKPVFYTFSLHDNTTVNIAPVQNMSAKEEPTKVTLESYDGECRAVYLDSHVGIEDSDKFDLWSDYYMEDDSDGGSSITTKESSNEDSYYYAIAKKYEDGKAEIRILQDVGGSSYLMIDISDFGDTDTDTLIKSLLATTNIGESK